MQRTAHTTTSLAYHLRVTGRRSITSHDVVIFLGLSLTLAYVFFFRGHILGYSARAVFFPIIGLCILAVALEKRKKRQQRYVLLLMIGGLCTIAIFSLGHALFNNARQYSVFLFGAEIAFNWAIFCLFLYVGATRSFKFLSFASLLALFLFAVFLGYTALNIDSGYIRRLGGIDDALGLSVATNHLGHASLLSAISAIACIPVVRNVISRKHLFAGTAFFVFAILTILAGFVFSALTGSRAGFAGLLAALLSYVTYIMLRSFGFGTMKKMDLLGAGVLVLGAVLIMASLTMMPSDSFGAGSRFTLDRLIGSLHVRIDLFYNTLAEINPISLFFGAPHRYDLTALQGVDTIFYPHNIIATSIAHLGLIITVPIFIFSVYILYAFLQIPTCTRFEKVLAFACIMVLVAYALTSGRLTRILTLPAFIGFISGAVAQAQFSHQQLRYQLAQKLNRRY